MAAEKPSSEARRQRLARALKANIGRRKAQAKGREEEEAVSPDLPPDEEGCPN